MTTTPKPLPLPAQVQKRHRRTPKEREARLVARTATMWILAAAFFFLIYAYAGVQDSRAATPQTQEADGFVLQSLNSAADAVFGRPHRSFNESDEDDEEPECEHIESQYPAMCEFVSEYCESEGVLNYLKFRYCEWGGANSTSRFTIHAPVLIVWFFLIIGVLASTAEQYFVPALEHLSEELNLSPDIAGITLVAFGNGGPDIVSAIAAVKSDDFSLAVGGLVGAAIFLCTLCVGIIYAMAGSRMLIAKETFLRDIIAMIVASAALVGMMQDNQFHLAEALGILAIYCIYVGFVVWWSKRNTRAADMNRVAAASIHNKTHHGGHDHHHLTISDVDEGYGIRNYSAGADRQHIGDSRRSDLAVDDDLEHPLLVGSAEHDIQSVTGDEDDDVYRMAGLSWPRKSDHWITKAQYFVELPFSFLRWLTVPSHEIWDRKRKWFTVFSMPGLALLLLFCILEQDGFSDTVAMGSADIPIWTIVFVVGCILGVAVYFWTPPGDDVAGDDLSMFVVLEDGDRRGLTTAQRRVLMVLAFLGSMGWLYIVADEVVAILQALGIMWDIGTAMLGLTVLAIGNCIGDLAANVAVARGNSNEGPATAVASCFGSPLLNFMLGLGIALTIACIDDYPEQFKFESDSQVNLAWVFLGIVLILNLVLLPMSKWRPKPFIGITLAAVYVIFIIFSVLMEVDVLTF